MTFIERIDFDVRSLELYFRRLFSLLNEPLEIPDPPLEETDVYAPHGYAIFIRPDMVSNIYSMLDFWLNHICEASVERYKLSLTHRDIRGNNDLDARHKYLTKVARLDLASVESSYQHLGIVRETRNCLLHAGGHANDQLTKRLSAFPNISVLAGVVTIEDAFIWTSLNHARAYLATAAEALEGERS